MSDIKLLKNELIKHPQHNVIFCSELKMTDSINREVSRTIYAGGSDDQFFTGSSHLNIILTDCDGGLDIFHRFDALESVMIELTESNEPELLLGKASDVRNKMLPLEKEVSYSEIIPDSAELVLDMLDISKYDCQIVEIDEEDKIVIEASLDISYDKSDRLGIRVFSDTIEKVTHDTENKVTLVTFKSSGDNYDIMSRINSYELMIDKLITTTTKSKRFNLATLKQARKLVKTNAVNAY